MALAALRRLRGALLLFAALAAGSGGAHEFWMLPEAFALPAGESTRFTLTVGQDFSGEGVAFSAPLVASLRHLSRRADVDLRLLAPTGGAAALRLRFPQAGTHIVALDTRASAIELPAGKFNDYLRQEGLVAALEARERAGASDRPGREHYRRNVKTLLQVGAAADATWQRRTGQKLEIVPLADPAALAPQQSLPMQVWFENRPLAGALVKLWNGAGAERVALSAVSDADGRVSFVLPRAGPWMSSVVHMIPAQAAADHDWESYWGNLTFAVPPRRD